jgi:hypothetical protein
MNALKLTKQHMLNEIPERFANIYFGGAYGENNALKAEKLLGLSKPVDGSLVDSIIGNNSWTSFDCEVCGEPKELLMFFEPHNYCPDDNRGMKICEKCLGVAHVN